jgi:hypothetical protein
VLDTRTSWHNLAQVDPTYRKQHVWDLLVPACISRHLMTYITIGNPHVLMLR